MKRLFAIVLVAMLALSLFAVLAGPASAQTTGAKIYVAHLEPLNGSGVHGTAFFILRGHMLLAMTMASGLEPGQVHMQHIHGLLDGTNSTCPPASADTNGDGLISLVEGLPFYGPVLVPLTPYPTASGMGKITYAHLFTGTSLDPLMLGTVPLTHRSVVVHGMTVNGTYDMTLPVACGEIERWR